ncbi:MAG: ATP-binding protein, partial [Thermoleophilia bacterium]
MRIEGWRVDGFGILRDHEVRGLGGGLTAFLGPNEAGKSTLLAFLRGVLVGYPSKGAAAHYPPLNGGEHGGRVFLRGSDGEVIVERSVGSKEPRVVFPERIDHGDEVVRRLLGGVDAGLFNSVFAFSLTELQDLRSLTEEGVRDRIFSAGIAGAGRSARQAAGRLEKEASELLRPRKGGLINELMDRLSEAEALVSAARSAASRYPQLLEVEAAAGAEVEAAQAEARSLRDALRRHELLQELWPAYYDGEEARKELESLGPLQGLPHDPE